MKHSGIIAIVFIVGCATGGVAAQLVVPPVRAGTSPTRWEYQCSIVGTDAGITSDLNKFGAEGWELVSMAPASTASAPNMALGPGDTRVEAYTRCMKRALP